MSARVLSVHKMSPIVSGSSLHATAEGDLRLKLAIQRLVGENDASAKVFAEIRDMKDIIRSEQCDAQQYSFPLPSPPTFS